MRARIGLTPREQEITELVCALGLSNQEIGDRLGISEQTAHRHLKHVYRNFRIWGRGNKRIRLVRLVWSVPEWRRELTKHW